MRIFCVSLLCIIISAGVTGQDCTIIAKANNISPDKLCSPVTISWNVSYAGVNDVGTPVQIRFEWDDGDVEILTAVRSAPGMFNITAGHSYTSNGIKCNYRPKASLIVNGVLCSSSTQQQIVTVWDDDDHNGGEMHINPEIYPVCYGNSASVRFRDMTRFNCVPPQEEDVPNLHTRWIQWIYGTDNTMTGDPVTVNGAAVPFPYSSDVISLPGPVSGSGVYSDFIIVADDKLIGQYFEVTLRNWNYCNPYDDPEIPGPPADIENGDNPPVVTTAKILIVPYPDATIDPVDTLCVENSPVTLSAHDEGGSWSGPGVSGNRFNPSVAGTGNHTIRYSVTSRYGCTDTDSISVTVLPPPDVAISRAGPLFITHPPVTLEASPGQGTWSGTGMNGALFNPMDAGLGKHIITYTTQPDVYGCKGSDTVHINVIMPALPIADFGPDTAGCSPFSIRFRNLSINADAWVWDFGDKTYSAEKEPVHTYHVPGNYIVTLTAINYSGEDAARKIITVHQGPSAMFEIYPPEVINNNQIVIFTNYSVHGSEWLWNFGDGKISTEEAPWHRYENEGLYTVSLRVKSPDGCVDSAVYRSPIKVHYKTGDIRFPNAFRWNQAGPTGGYWNEGGLTDYIFRPFFTNVTEYYLQVFNRWGTLIYESRDIYKGWDGYYEQGNLAIQGVYVWKVKGKYADGTWFEKVGDVSFLH